MMVGVPAMADPPAADVAGFLNDDVLLERYRYPPGPAVELPAHSHEEYQLNLNLGLPGGVVYRGDFHVVPPESLAVIMPGEVHVPRDCGDRDAESSHLALYVGTETVGRVVDELSPGRAGLPFFRDLVISDRGLVNRFVQAHASLAGPSSTLGRDVTLLAMLSGLVERAAGVRASRPAPVGHRAVRRARDYLHDNVAGNVSLTELARESGLSPYYLTRAFTTAVGVPPHRYQLHLRLEHAKRLLLAGRSVTATGHEAGFFDLSHFSRHFKRYVGVTPGAYARLVP